MCASSRNAGGWRSLIKLTGQYCLLLLDRRDHFTELSYSKTIWFITSNSKSNRCKSWWNSPKTEIDCGRLIWQLHGQGPFPIKQRQFPGDYSWCSDPAKCFSTRWNQQSCIADIWDIIRELILWLLLCKAASRANNIAFTRGADLSVIYSSADPHSCQCGSTEK